MSAYALRQTRRFARTYKKLHDNVACDVDAAARFAQHPHVDILDILARTIDDSSQRRHVVGVDKH